MTLTFNPKSYAALLAKYQPKVITTEEENDRALAIASELVRTSPKSHPRRGCAPRTFGNTDLPIRGRALSHSRRYTPKDAAASDGSAKP